MKGRKKASGKPPNGPWEPSTRDLELYARLCRGKTLREVGEEFEISYQRVHIIAQQIDRWLAPQLMEQIREIKARHTESLMHIFREAMSAWELSKGDHLTVTEKEGDKPETITQRKHNKLGASAYLSEARAALAEIRKIWGADATVKGGTEEGIRAAGMEPEEAKKIYARAKIEQYQRMLESSPN